MASSRVHFTDPDHPLEKTKYRKDETGHCSICLLNLAGHGGYGCFECNIHVHSACAGFFQETISSSFAHPSHELKLRRSHGLTCSICRGYCPPGGFAYRCSVGCCAGFDVHPLCAMLPERVTSSRFHPGHGLRMVSSPGGGECCSACRQPLHDWRYVCSCSLEQLHITCAIDMSIGAGAGDGEVRNGPAPAAGAGQGSHYHGAGYQRIRGGYGDDGGTGKDSQSKGWYDYGPAAFQGYGTGAPAGGQGWHYGGYGPTFIPPPGGYNYNYNYNPGGFQFQGYGGGQGSYPNTFGGYGYPNTHGGYGGGATGGVQSMFGKPSGMMTTIARVLLGMVMVNTPVGDFASQLDLSGLF